MSINTHLVYADLIFNCLTLAEGDARALVRIDTPKPFTFPDPYLRCPELSGYKVESAPLLIKTSNRIFAGAAYSELYFKGVRSMPSEILKMIACSHLSERYDLEGVPGFYQSGMRWRLNLPKTGILRPYRDEDNHILGLFIYRNHQDQTPGLLSSEGLYRGTKAIQPLLTVEREVA